MEETLAVDDAGNALTAFHRVAEHTCFGDAPLPAALTALWHDDRMLLVFDRFRQSWELPGGRIDPGETPRQAAVRELREETGLHIDDLFFAGNARFVLGAEQRGEYAAIYVAFLTEAPDTEMSAFVPNDEIGAIHWWDGVETLPGRIQMLDVVLARLAKDTYLESPPGLRALPAQEDTGDELITSHPEIDSPTTDQPGACSPRTTHPRVAHGDREARESPSTK